MRNLNNELRSVLNRKKELEEMRDEYDEENDELTEKLDESEALIKVADELFPQGMNRARVLVKAPEAMEAFSPDVVALRSNVV